MVRSAGDNCSPVDVRKPVPTAKLESDKASSSRSRAYWLASVTFPGGVDAAAKLVDASAECVDASAKFVDAAASSVDAAALVGLEPSAMLKSPSRRINSPFRRYENNDDHKLNLQRGPAPH